MAKPKPNPFALVECYCPKVEHSVSALGVCERRSIPDMKKAWPKCTGCDFRATLREPGDGEGLTTMSDPPGHWFNMDRYKALLGEDICKKHRGGGIGLL